MKNLSKKEAQRILSEVGHHANVTVETFDKEGYPQTQCVLNNAIPFSLGGAQLGSSDNSSNAKKALAQIKKAGGQFKIYSSYFYWATGEYSI